MRFSKEITNWYDENKRDLLWRNTKNPYLIWVSEIILQQTRVAQGTPYYIKFSERFPTARDLACADEMEVLKLWQGLGYYSRARNMKAAAEQIYKDFDNHFPDNYKKILSLKGVGEYTAAAIASFAFDLPYAVVDGNVYRVLSRLYNVATPIDTGAGKKEFQLLATKLLDIDNAGLHNQAIMEFGALQCVPKNPNCLVCIFKNDCFAFQKNKVNLLPLKSKKIKVRNRYFNYFLIKKNQKIYLEKRNDKDIWANMYQFPLIELPKVTVLKKLQQEKLNGIPLGNCKIEKIYSLVHKLSHQNIHASFYFTDLQFPVNSTLILCTKTELQQYPLPKIIELILEKNFIWK